MNRILISALLLGVTACTYSEGGAADSSVALPVDTLKPLYTRAQEDSIRDADSARVADSVAAATAAAKTPATPARTSTTTKTAPTRTTPSPTKADSLSPNIGRDSVIRRPIRRLPAAPPDTIRVSQ